MKSSRKFLGWRGCRLAAALFMAGLTLGAASAQQDVSARPPLYYYDFDGGERDALARIDALAFVWSNRGTGEGAFTLKEGGGAVPHASDGGALGSSHAFYRNRGFSLWLGDGYNSLGCGTERGFTISFWLKPDAAHGAWSDFLGFRVGGVDYRVEYMTNNVDFTVYARNRLVQTSLTGRLDNSVSQALAGTWNHVAFVFAPCTNAAGTAAVYVGGERVANLSLEESGDLRWLFVGGRVKGKNGEDRASPADDTGIDELAVFDFAASAEQVKWLGAHRPAKAEDRAATAARPAPARKAHGAWSWECRHPGEWDANLADFPRLAGETDDAPRFLRAVAAAPNGVLRVPKGEYDVASPIRITNRCSLSMHPAAHLVARAKMDYVVFWDGAADYHALSVYNPDGSVYDNPNLFIRGGDIDGNGLASCLAIANSHHFTLADITLHNGKAFGLRVTRETGGHLYELVANNVYCKTTMSGLAGNVGIECQMSDCHFTDCFVIDYTKGIRSTGGANRFTRCHVWGGTVPPKGMGFKEWSDAYARRKRMEGARKWTQKDESAYLALGVPEMLPGSAAFESFGGANVFDGCFADTAEIGFDVRNGAVIVNSGFFNNPRMNLRKSTAIVHRNGRLRVAFCDIRGPARCEKLYEGSGKDVTWIGNDVSTGANMAADAARLFGKETR